MKILIDADGCPVVDITVRIAKARKIECLILCDTSHVFEKDGATTLIFSKARIALILHWSTEFLLEILSSPRITGWLLCVCPKTLLSSTKMGWNILATTLTRCCSLAIQPKKSATPVAG